ncbi:MAG: two-component sensor histidine kinase [Anaerolineaceae bacterium]|nr:two-component sensor histidine kinase [Anaerolineaceae bacterium]
MRLRIILAFLIVITIALSAVFIFAQQATTEQVRAFLGRGGWMGTSELVPQLEEYYQSLGSWNGVESLFQNTGRGRQGSGAGKNQPAGSGPAANISLIDPDGHIIYSTVFAADTIVPEERLSTGIPIEVNGAVQAYLLPVSGSASPGPEFEEALLTIIQQATIKAAWISGLIALVLALVLATILIRPVKSLTKAANRLAMGKLDTRVNVKSPTELATLGKTFNQMAQSLEDAEKNRKVMTADIAHELRTPLAVQRANLEALQDGVFPLNTESINQVLSQNILLTRLVEDLRILALVDAGELRLEKRPTDLASLVKETAERFRAQALENKITLTVEAESPLPMVEVDPERIQQVLYNLLQNGLRYTPSGGTVRICYGVLEGQVVVQVMDSGPGIDADALPFIFDRFYRADKARDRERGGTGLGLTIARQLMLAHGGDLTVSNQNGGGAVFKLVLPV